MTGVVFTWVLSIVTCSFVAYLFGRRQVKQQADAYQKRVVLLDEGLSDSACSVEWSGVNLARRLPRDAAMNRWLTPYGDDYSLTFFRVVQGNPVLYLGGSEELRFLRCAIDPDGYADELARMPSRHFLRVLSYAVLLRNEEAMDVHMELREANEALEADAVNAAMTTAEAHEGTSSAEPAPRKYRSLRGRRILRLD